MRPTGNHILLVPLLTAVPIKMSRANQLSNRRGLTSCSSKHLSSYAQCVYFSHGQASYLCSPHQKVFQAFSKSPLFKLVLQLAKKKKNKISLLFQFQIVTRVAFSTCSTFSLLIHCYFFQMKSQMAWKPYCALYNRLRKFFKAFLQHPTQQLENIHVISSWWTSQSFSDLLQI